MNDHDILCLAIDVFRLFLKYIHSDKREQLVSFQLMCFIWTFHQPDLLYFVHGTLAATEPSKVDWEQPFTGHLPGQAEQCRQLWLLPAMRN